MEQAQFEHLKAQVAAAPAAQTLEIEDVIQGVVSLRVAEFALARRTRQTRDKRMCPHCTSNDIKLYGKDQNGRQRFKCRSCRKTYNILTGTPMARARKPEKWGQYLGCMTDHMSLRKIVASGIGVHLVTAWRWRHRFLTAAANDNAAVLSGVVEADKTCFPHSLKGARRLNKGKPLKNPSGLSRGRDDGNPDLRPRPVPVLMALDSGGGVFETILPSLAEIEAALEGRIASGSVLCSDGSGAYINVAERAGAQHYTVTVQAATQDAAETNSTALRNWKPGRLGLRRVHSHDRRLKYLINERCRGVATKYLAHYMGWHRAMIRPGFLGKMLLARALR